MNDRKLIVFRDPIADASMSTGNRYASKSTLDADAAIAPVAAPQSTIRVADLLP